VKGRSGQPRAYLRFLTALNGRVTLDQATATRLKKIKMPEETHAKITEPG
jgi:hypothetical protein